ncbi:MULTISPECIES: PAS domain-containing sensor histidine kinase [Rhizobium]|jgi:sigma-B regulation protein RsbU (phosphoserine phosphatase)|uniref:PAS domain-containing sensor histidine kinase n=1 Tax=Rhizobium TaxID=379 RepID=UPI000522F9B6|nr:MULTISPECIES: PAS domain-containing sensor histidine kinase [Rhizobium]KPN26197.1 histidine kinase [Rhizobium brockwellii]MDV4152969.1 PAS domain-containing sensor histidine kinase [Rhizobium brockwellii]QIO53049.1 PAS domain-containing sensor histidine kinase [Rhizobium leguminosarum bv. trifolii]QJX03985.1 PAS domain-containing sensor histidine kinase [Rhizobium brockwellii]TAX33363.1 PAS domain-containing sensor histidine kinase [Rhizobium leguminosarum]
MSGPDTQGSMPAEDLEDLYENAPCGYLSLQPDGRIVKVNRTLQTWIGIPAEQLLGKRLHDLLNTSGRIFYETHFAPLLRMQGFFNEVALDLVTADGRKLPVLANAMERRSEDGALLFTRVTMFQAAERRRYERELVEARAAADAAGATIKSQLDFEQQTAELREQFIAILGHDLRNPLASIAAAGRMLRKEEQTDRSTKVLDLMQGSVVRMSGLIDNVLDFARARLGGGIVLDRRAEVLEPILRQVIEELRYSHLDRAIEVSIELDGPINCDSSRIGQLVSNLLGNALTHGTPDEPVRLSAATVDGRLELWIANGGAPISSDAMTRLFQPFFKGEAGTSQRGLGLGLYIASEIARAHGGTIMVSSDDQETCFTFVMPLD